MDTRDQAAPRWEAFVDDLLNAALKKSPDMRQRLGSGEHVDLWNRESVRAALYDVAVAFLAAAATPPAPWPVLLPLLNDYAMAMTDAASHQSDSKVDIANSQALKALQNLRAAIYGDANKYGEVAR